MTGHQRGTGPGPLVALAAALCTVLTLVVGCGPAGARPAVAFPNPAPGSHVYYLALGDSVPVWDGDQSYPNLLLAHEQAALPDLQLANLAVSGETSQSMIQDGQYQAALGFLRAHPNEVAFITLDIGGNDFLGCVSPGSQLNQQCFDAALKEMANNITMMLAGFRAVAPSTPVYSMSYYDPFLGDWFAGGQTASDTLAGIPDVVTLNQTLASVYGPTHVADVQGAFQVTDDTDMVDSPWGTAPVDVVDACQWLDIVCAAGQPEGFGDDPNPAGQVQIAQAFEQVVPDPIETAGYAVAAADGEVATFGASPYQDGVNGLALAAPVAGAATTPDGGGRWLVGRDGGVFALGDAPYLGSLGGRRLNAPIVGMAPTPDGRGYWLVGADGGVFCFGDASYLGSVASRRLNAPIVGMAPTPDGRGYWLVGADGGVFALGDARYLGSLAGIRLAAPVVGLAPTADGRGYRMAAADGGVFAFGDAPYPGSAAGRPGAPVVGLLPREQGSGMWLLRADGAVVALGGAPLVSPSGAVGFDAPAVALTP